jgi:hypothetical protein
MLIAQFYSAHQDAFVNGGYQGDKLAIALQAHTRLGYNFIVSEVALATTHPDTGNGTVSFPTVQLDVTVKQVGVAPFYYPLSLLFDCPDLNSPLEQKGVESIIAEGDVKRFSFHGIPATQSCLNSTSLQMNTLYAYSKRPIKFAQGLDGTVKLNLPIPPSTFSAVNATTDIPSISPSIERSLFPSIFQNVETSEHPTILTAPSSVPLPALITSNGSSVLTVNDIHAFNTNFTPSLMKLEAERRQQKQFHNRFVVGVVGSVLVAAIFLTAFRLRNRRRREKDLPHATKHQVRVYQKSHTRRMKQHMAMI